MPIKLALMAVILFSSTAVWAFPESFDHKYGTTTLTEAPERIVSIGYSDHDDLLALGQKPLAVRDWYGDMDKATWPWAADLWGSIDPVVLPFGELDMETIAALEPDLIVGLSSGISAEHYQQLSLIAPTLPQSGDYIEWGMPWHERTLWIGRAVGRLPEAEAMVEDVEQRFESVTEQHPELGGMQAAIAYYWEGQLGVYSDNDLRGVFLERLGLNIPEAINDLAGDRFYSELSLEELSLLNVDALIWLSTGDAQADADKVPGRELMPFHQQGREIYVDKELGGAFSFMSPLSIHFIFDELVPQIVQVVDTQR